MIFITIGGVIAYALYAFVLSIGEIGDLIDEIKENGIE